MYCFAVQITAVKTKCLEALTATPADRVERDLNWNAIFVTRNAATYPDVCRATSVVRTGRVRRGLVRTDSIKYVRKSSEGRKLANYMAIVPEATASNSGEGTT